MKLYELQKWTKIKFNNDDIYLNNTIKNWDILEFLWVDGYYCEWKKWDEIIIMWWAYEDVDTYWEVVSFSLYDYEVINIRHTN